MRGICLGICEGGLIFRGLQGRGGGGGHPAQKHFLVLEMYSSDPAVRIRFLLLLCPTLVVQTGI